MSARFVVFAPSAALGLALSAGCRPDLGAPASLVERPTVIAVRSDPPEARPGASVVFQVVVAGPEGGLPEPAAAWAFCTSPKPPAENNVVSPGCLATGSGVPVAATGEMVTAALPADGCSRFGPDTPTPEPGKPPSRPRDPDVTGGFFQPLRVDVPAAGGSPIEAVALQRITCNLPNAPSDVAQDFRRRYQPNRNPLLRSLSLGPTGGAPQPVFAAGATPPPTVEVSAGSTNELRATFDPESAESYPVFDLADRRIADHREALRVSWFVTAGKLDHDATGRGEADMQLDSANGWVAPPHPGLVHMWVVLRDSRGGIDFAAFDVMVAER